MTFYCLRRAWPHIIRLGAMSGLTEAAAAAKTALLASEDPAARPALEAAHQAAITAMETADADMIGQTGEALSIIAAALSLIDRPPLADDLAKRLRPEEMPGVQICVSLLLQASGLFASGEVMATGRMPGMTRSSGID